MNESDVEIFIGQLKNIARNNVPQISRMLPSAWVEANIVMGKPFPGPFRYRRTPYVREMIDILSPDCPCWGCAVKKGAQIGISSGLIIPGICWKIANNPGNTSLSVGAPDLISKAMDKLDAGIDSSGIRKLISPQAKRARNNKTGDTSKQKDFPNGFVMIWYAGNHKNIRQVDLETQFNDDFVAIKKSSSESGSSKKKLDQRSAAYADTKKIFDISTPELVGSNIDEAYEKGDKRRWLIPCPCCNDFITIDWTIPSLKVPGKMAGITWQLKENGQLDKATVGYICPLCDGFFDDRNKQEWLNKGEWVPFAVSKLEGYRSYHISALYAPIGMDGWDKYINDYIEANPPGQPRKEDLWHTFMNECLGESYTPDSAGINSGDLEKNIRGYSIDTVPDAISMADGNGHIVMLTLSCDLGGRYIGDQLKSGYDDARLDWELIGHAESGGTYSLNHGSIGTFTNAYLGKKDAGRELWSYDLSKPNNVWKALDVIRVRKYSIDGGKTHMEIQITGIDSGFADHHVFSYIESRRATGKIVALKGEKENRPVAVGIDKKHWKYSASRENQFIIQVGHIKDKLRSRVGLVWDRNHKQPAGLLNFPQRVAGKYEKDNYFAHFEAEHRKIDEKKGTFIWEKKTSNVQNHMWDCFDEHTEVLTKKGWMLFKDLSYTDELATVNLNSDALEYQNPKQLISKNYSGNAVSINTTRVSALVTEDHRMVVYRKKWNKETNSGRMLTVPEVVLAKDLRLTDTLKLSATWTEKGTDFYIIPELKDKYGKTIAKEKIIPSKLWAAFLGIYIAEGGSGKNYSAKRGSHAHVVCVHQNLGVKFDLIKDMMDKIPFKYHISKGRGIQRQFVISQQQLYLELQKHGKNYYTKTSGDWIKNQSVEVIKEFIYFAMLGDGHEQKGGHRTYYTTSKQLSDDMQELILKAGKHSSVHTVDPNGVCQRQYHISENKTIKANIRRAKNEKLFETINYNGMVYCASVPNGTLVVRRNGKVFVAGNCNVYGMALRDINMWHVFKEIGVDPKEGTWRDFCEWVLDQWGLKSGL